LELALNELQRQRAGIDEEIEAIQVELKGTGATVRQTASIPSAGIRRGRTRTAAERKAQAQRMREYWAKKKGKAAKPAPASAKVRTKTAAQKKALSLKMREVWKKRKAAAAKKSQVK
jgi:hypothetical protein